MTDYETAMDHLSVVDRDFGLPALLSPKQRKYYHGYTDIEEGSSQERTVRSRIRNRLAHSIADMSTLWMLMESRDIEQTFEKDLVQATYKRALYLLLDGSLRAAKGRGAWQESEEQWRDNVEFFEDEFTNIIRHIFTEGGASVRSCEVSIDVEFGPALDKLEDKSLTDLTTRELGLLFVEGDITEEELEQAIIDKKRDRT